MANSETPMTLADRAMVNALAALVTMRVRDAKRQELLVGILRDAWEKSESDNPYVSAVADAVRSFLIQYDQDPVRWTGTSAWFEMSFALERFFFWRLSLAQQKSGMAA